MVVNDTKIYQKMENKSLFSIEKKYCKMRKASYYNYFKLISFRKSTISLCSLVLLNFYFFS